MTAEKKNPGRLFGRGILGDNPALRLGLGICPALAATTRAANGLTLGLATACVLVCSALVTSLIKGILPRKGRWAVLLAISAVFATLARTALRLTFPEITAELGVFVPLIAVNALLLSRLDDVAAEASPAAALADSLGMGLGYALALTLIGVVRELIGCGSVFGAQVLGAGYEPMLLAVLPAGGFLIYGLIAGIFNALAGKRPEDGEEARS